MKSETLTIMLLATAFSTALLAETKSKPKRSKATTDEAVAPVESVLDRLEQQLIESDKEGLTFGGKQGRGGEQKSPSQIFRFERKTITATNEESERLKEISVSIAELENQVDMLSQDLQKERTRVLDMAKLDTTLDLTVTLEQPDKVVIRQLDVSLDGFRLYSVDEAEGLWIPAREIPIYSGPIDPGQHKLIVESKLIQRSEGKVQLNLEPLASIRAEFPVQLKDVRSKGRYAVVIHPPQKAGTEGSIELRDTSNKMK